jgi:hypothetical protein
MLKLFVALSALMASVVVIVVAQANLPRNTNNWCVLGPG